MTLAGSAAYPRLVTGDVFASSTTADPEAIWGIGQRVLWARGEGLMLVAPQGVGKTTLAQQIMLGRAKIRRNDLCGLAVKPGGRQLYLAADRPRQAARSLARMVDQHHMEQLRDRVLVHAGPLPFDITKDSKALARFALECEADTLYIDSLKDVAVDLSKDETGSRVNLAFQEVIAAEIELVVNHHQRKAQAGNTKPKALDDVYGSTWLTAGMGSVVLLWGEPGDLVVELSHLKQPAEDVGPLTLLHDHARGLTTVQQEGSIEEILANANGTGLLVRDAAALLCNTADPTRNQIEKARRRLEGLVGTGYAERRAGATEKDASTYFVRNVA